MNEEMSVGCVVPFAQSTIIGVFSAGVFYGVMQLLDLAWWYVLFGACLAALTFFVSSMVLAYRYQFGPGQVAPVTGQETPTVKVQIKHEPNRTQFIELPCSEDQLVELAKGVLQRGVPLSEGVWCGRMKPFSKAQFHHLRDEMLKRGLVAWRNEGAPAQGVEVLEPGIRTFQSVLAPYQWSGND